VDDTLREDRTRASNTERALFARWRFSYIAATTAHRAGFRIITCCALAWQRKRHESIENGRTMKAYVGGSIDIAIMKIFLSGDDSSL